MTKHLVKKGRKIKGYVFQDKNNPKQWWYAFGRPSQYQTMVFGCRSLEHGIACIEFPLLNNQ